MPYTPPSPATRIFEVLDQIEFAMEAVTFTEFIFEEALQTAFFAISNAVRAKQYDLARQMLTTIQNDIYEPFEWYVDNIGFIAIYSWTAFKAYKYASQRQLQQYHDLLYS